MGFTMIRDIDSSDTPPVLSRFDCDGIRVMVAYSRLYVTQTGHLYFVLACLFHYFRLSDRIIEHC